MRRDRRARQTPPDSTTTQRNQESVWHQQNNVQQRAVVVKEKDGTIIFEKDKVLDIWVEYVGDLFDEDRPPKPEIAEGEGPAILQSEVKNALKEMRNNKAAGLDGIQAEMLKALDDYGIIQLTHLLNRIYDTGYLPSDLLESVFITLPPKPKATECGEFRTISLMSHIMKLLLKIILNRNQVLLNDNSGEPQFGFKSGSGTRDAIFTMRIVTQKCLEKGKYLYVCFIDYAKAFDRVQHQKAFECLRNTRMDSKDLRVITNLYWNQIKGHASGMTMKFQILQKLNEVFVRAASCHLACLIFIQNASLKALKVCLELT